MHNYSGQNLHNYHDTSYRDCSIRQYRFHCGNKILNIGRIMIVLVDIITLIHTACLWGGGGGGLSYIKRLRALILAKAGHC